MTIKLIMEWYSKRVKAEWKHLIKDAWHYPVHVTPRYANDHFYGTIQQRCLMTIQERARLAREICSRLDQ